MRPLIAALSLLPAVALSTPLAHAAPLPPPALEITVLHDLVETFSPERARNAADASARLEETSGGVSLPGVFLHPVSRGESAIVYPGVDLPALASGESCLLLFRIGFRDGIPWERADAAAPNGARFAVVIDEERVFEETVASTGWRARAVDLSRWAGQSIRLELRTGAVEGNTSYDWSVFGDPLVVMLRPIGEGAARDGPGVGVARIRCEAPARVKVAVGGVAERVSLPAGTHVVPVPAPLAPEVEVDVEIEEGNVELLESFVAAHAPRLEATGLELSTSLLTAGRPLAAVVALANRGRGRYPGGAVAWLREFQGDGGGRIVSTGRLEVPPLEAGERRSARLEVEAPPAPGRLRLSVAYGALDIERRVFPAEPSWPGGPPGERAARILEADGATVRATAGVSVARVGVVVDRRGGEGYAVLEAWDGERWRRAGSIHPLARLVWRGAGGERREATLGEASVSVEDGALVVRGSFEREGEPAWPVSVTFEPEDSSPRIRLRAIVEAPRDAELLAFHAPVVLAGDRSFGARKDFAIFPGLEFLEGKEPSSSERDLVYPLSDRRVPAARKVTSPLMAVEGRDLLVALIWSPEESRAEGELHPAARFLAPEPGSGLEHVHLSLFCPPVGEYVPENAYEAERPYTVRRGETLRLASTLVIDHRSRHPEGSLARGPHRGGLVLESMRHLFEVRGFPEPSPMPRSWEEEKALSRDAYLHALWREEPPGWSHCHGWSHGLLVGHAVPLVLDLRDGAPPGARAEVSRRIDRIVERAVEERGGGSLASSAGCHIVSGELPFFRGRLAESLEALRAEARALLAAREDGLWVWKPADRKRSVLGTPGDHTLGQAAGNAFRVLRAARLTGDPELAREGLEAFRQVDLYDVPRGAQTWECPLYQPDILAAALAIRASCEAYRLTGDTGHLARARYWAWAGLPFLYTWDMDGYPTMRWNVIAVIGSTFYRHSWLGLPVVWCGLVYAYALQDLAELDEGRAGDIDWRKVARGITRSAMWQQYDAGPQRGCYPDSWDMVRNAPNPADLNPENILMNAFRLRGVSPEIRSARIAVEGGRTALLNTAADILSVEGDVREGRVRFRLASPPGFSDGGVLAQVARPAAVEGLGEEVGEREELEEAREGWLFDEPLRAVIFKSAFERGAVEAEVRW